MWSQRVDADRVRGIESAGEAGGDSHHLSADRATFATACVESDASAQSRFQPETRHSEPTARNRCDGTTEHSLNDGTREASARLSP